MMTSNMKCEEVYFNCTGIRMEEAMYMKDFTVDSLFL